MITKSPINLLLTLGVLAFVAVALFFPVEAFATDIKAQSQQLGKQVAIIPRLIALGSYVIGAFFAVRALFALKGFIEDPDDNPITKVLGFAAVSALLILLPYIIEVMTNSIKVGSITDVQSSQAKFVDQGTLN